jgi:hypothetical protein
VDCVLFVAFVKEEPKRRQGAHFRERTEKTAGQQTYGNISAVSELKRKAFAKASFSKKILKPLL